MSTALHTLVWLGEVIPRVENPLPETIGLGFPFTLAGAGSVIGTFVRPRATAAERDRWARLCSAWALAGGFVLYGFALAYQLASTR